MNFFSLQKSQRYMNSGPLLKYVINDNYPFLYKQVQFHPFHLLVLVPALVSALVPIYTMKPLKN